MDNNNNPQMPQPGGESLNERLRRAAEMARRNMAAENTAPKAPASEPQRPVASESQRPVSQASEPQRPAAEPQCQASTSLPPIPPKASAPKASSATAAAAEVPASPKAAAAEKAPVKAKPKKTLIAIIALAVLLALAILAMVFLSAKNNAEVEAQQQEIEQLKLQNEQIQLANEYESLNNEYAQYENQTALLANDSIVQKYAAARAQVEKLLDELKNEKNKSAAQISKLKGEIETLKTILRSYVEQINELKQENQSLRSENEEVKAQNSQLSQTVQSVQATNQHLNERMTLAEKLNVTGVNLTALNKKGKTEKNVTKARQLEVSFTIPQNNSTPVGEKTIYLRITSPEGELLGNSGSFKFEGATLQCTARKSVEYQGEEIAGIKIYWDVSATLNPGDYTVELFADNYRLASRRFTLKK
jgi:predicted  nucleic acid-binding Zn-ribbon protein